MSHKDTAVSRMDADLLKWQLDRIFSIWNSAIQEISDWIQAAGTYRSTVVLVKVNMAFFNNDDFTEMTTRPNKTLLAMFMLALEIEFEWALYCHYEGYKTSDDYCLPKLLTKSTHIYSVPSVAESSFNPTDYQKPTMPTSPLTPLQSSHFTEWSADDKLLRTCHHLQWILIITHRRISWQHPLMTRYGPKNPY